MKAQLINRHAIEILSESTKNQDHFTWKDFIETPRPEVSDLDACIPYYEDTDDAIWQKWDVVENYPSYVSEKIENLKKHLIDTDYLLLKLQDGALTAQEYESTRLKRVQWREQINELEQLLIEQ